MTILTLAAALAAQALPAPGAVIWQPVSEDSGGRYSIDPASIVRDGDRVRFLMRAFATRAEADGVDSAVVHYVIDCRRRASATLAADFYRGEAFAHSRETDAAAVERQLDRGFSGEERLIRRVCPPVGP